MRDGNGVPPGFDELAAEFELLGELGRGGMAVVYHAREREGGREVALKVIRARYMEDEEVLARFAHEVRTLTRLQHPNIVSTYAVRQLSEGSLVLAMEHVPGRTLREVIRWNGPLPIEQVEQVLRDVAEALAYAHRQGIVHRDVKPDNIFLHERTGAALLSDFGIAKSRDSDTQLTMTGVAVGTPAYMSPEQIDGHSVDGRSDVFSLGVVGWEMLSGRRAWEGETLYSIIYKQKHEDLRAVRDLRSDVPERLELLIAGALLKDPAVRWATAEDVLAQLGSGSRLGSRRSRRAAERRRLQVVEKVLAVREQRQALQEEEERTIRYRRFPVPAPEPEPQTREETHASSPRRTLQAASLVLFVAAGTWLLASAGFRGPAADLRLAAIEAPFEEDGELLSSIDFLAPNGRTSPPFPRTGEELGGAWDSGVWMVAPEAPAADAQETESGPAAAHAGGIPASAQQAGTEREPSPAERERAAPERTAPAAQPRQNRSGLLGEPVDTAARGGPSGDAPAASGFDSAAASESEHRPAAHRDCASNRSGTVSLRGAPDECTLSLAVGQSLQLSASRGSLRGSLAGGPRAPGRAGWRSSNPAVATVDANGVVHAVSPGSATITATAPGMGGSITIVVGASASPEP